MFKNDRNDIKKLYEAILSLASIEECSIFFDDICTVQEIEALAQRLEVANLLKKGKSYVDINKLTGASTATICRVSKALNYGDGGYQVVLERLEKDEI